MAFRKDLPSTSPDLLSPEEIVRLLRKYQAAGGGRRDGVSLKAIADMAGLDRDILTAIRAGSRRTSGIKYVVSGRIQAVLSPILKDIEQGRIRFSRNRKTRFGEPGHSEARIEYRHPPVRPPPPQPRVIRADDYNEWASCQSCGSPRFSRFVADRPYYACDGCVSEPDRIMLGARGPT